jgi:hypothetical protein
MDLAATLIALGAVVAGGVFAGWRGARPWNPAVGGVRMAPWRLIMVLCGAAALGEPGRRGSIPERPP